MLGPEPTPQGDVHKNFSAFKAMLFDLEAGMFVTVQAPLWIVAQVGRTEVIILQYMIHQIQS